MNAPTFEPETVRQGLEQRRELLLRRVGAIERHLRQEDGRLTEDFSDRVAFVEADEVLVGLDDAGRAELEALSAALERLDEGSYGTCLGCGGPIAPGRLLAVPTATRCIGCAGQ